MALEGVQRALDGGSAEKGDRGAGAHREHRGLTLMIRAAFALLLLLGLAACGFQPALA